MLSVESEAAFFLLAGVVSFVALKEGLKAKSDHIGRFPAHDFLYVGFTFQTSRTNNKGHIGTYEVRYMGYSMDDLERRASR